MATQIDKLFLAHIKSELADARTSQRRPIVEATARDCGVSVQTMYRKLQLGIASGRKARTVSESVVERRTVLDVYAKEVFLFALENSHDHSECSWQLALKFLKTEKRIPHTVTDQQIYKSIARQHLVSEYQPVAKRFERQTPLSLVQMDFTKSRHIKHVGDGRLMVKNPGATKIALDRKSLWCGAAIDDASRVVYLEYFIAIGESAREAQRFLVKAMSRKPSNAMVPHDFLLQGQPKAIYVDRGSGWVDGSTQVGLAKMGVQCIIGANEVDSLGRRLNRSNKKARGKVERTIRTLKEHFEMEFSLHHPHGTEITLAELNHALWEWLELFNQDAHPTNRREGKWNLFKTTLDTCEYPCDDALAPFIKQNRRKVVNRIINVGHGMNCIAPLFAPDGVWVEVIERQNRHFVFHDEQLYPLEYQEGTVLADDVPDSTLRLIIESDELVLEDSHINKRFGDELKKLTGGTIENCRGIPDEVWYTIESFFDAPQTVRDIKSKARQCVQQIASLANTALALQQSTLTLTEEGITLEL